MAVTQTQPTQQRSSPFTLIELLVVVAIISVLAAMLLPALQKAKKTAKIALCANQLKQNGIAHVMYQGDYDDYFPLFGGAPKTDSNGTYNTCAGFWFGSATTASSSMNYFTEYLQSDISTGGYARRKIAYCPAIDWLSLGVAISGDRMYFNRGFGGSYDASAGYFYWTGRYMKHISQTSGDINTMRRSANPNELIMSEFFANNTFYGPGPANNALGADINIPWFNPHVNQGCVVYYRPGSGYNLTADGSVRLVDFKNADIVQNRSQREIQYAVHTKIGNGDEKYLVTK